jgi:hypothetical protein
MEVHSFLPLRWQGVVGLQRCVTSSVRWEEFMVRTLLQLLVTLTIGALDVST